MDIQTAQKLSQVTQAFYAELGSSFFDTRSPVWPGWIELVELLKREGATCTEILDVGCGAMRFERFFLEQYPSAAFCAIDNLDYSEGVLDAALLERISYNPCDIADALLEGQLLADVSREEQRIPQAGEYVRKVFFDMSVCFAFMHHLPLISQRKTLLSELVRLTKPGGFIVFSAWQFAEDKTLLSKAQVSTAHALSELGISGLGPDDYLLSWQNRNDIYRFCHHISEQELDELIEGLASQVRELTRFSADGHTATLNRYVVLQKCV